LITSGSPGYDAGAAIPVEINGQIIEAVVFYNFQPSLQKSNIMGECYDNGYPPGLLGLGVNSSMARSFSMPEFNSLCDLNARWDNYFDSFEQ